MGGTGFQLVKLAPRFGRIWSKNTDAAEPAVKYAANACESPVFLPSGFDARGCGDYEVRS